MSTSAFHKHIYISMCHIYISTHKTERTHLEPQDEQTQDNHMEGRRFLGRLVRLLVYKQFLNQVQPLAHIHCMYV